jgi:methylated-DNA-[protein]-cysteine S-methyltransferase
VATIGDSRGDYLIRALADLAPTPVDIMARVFVQWCRVGSPIGDVFVAFTDHGVCYVRTADAVDDRRFVELLRENQGRPVRPAPRPLTGVRPALRSGRPGQLRFDLRSMPEFEQAVLTATAGIPVGETRPYGWIAQRIERPQASSAVAVALERNPVPLLIPCHRVTHANGDVAGHVLGRDVNEHLLRLEKVNVDEVSSLARAEIFFLGSDTTNIVCFPTCHHARRITPPHRRGFRTIGQARQAGYRPCKHCRPGELAS